MAKIFNTTVDNLIGRTDEPIKNPNRIRVLGSIPAGIPVEMVEDIGEFEDIPESWLSGGKEYFALKVKGNSMNPKYVENDIVIVLKENTCENGDDCIVVVNGFDATLKRVFIKENGLLLQPLNADYQATFYTCEEVRGEPGVKILGVIKEIRRKA
jgi:repressor LexA